MKKLSDETKGKIAYVVLYIIVNLLIILPYIIMALIEYLKEVILGGIKC